MITCGNAFAGVAATSFYRRPDAGFASGQARREVLAKTLLRQEPTHRYGVYWNKRNYTVSDEDLLTDAQCVSRAELRENSAIFDDSRGDSKILADLPKGAAVEVLRTQGNWSKVKSGKYEGWVPGVRLLSRNDDVGVFVALIDTAVRVAPGIASPAQTTLIQGTRLLGLGYTDDGWMRVRWGILEGFVDLHHLVGRADFAQWAYVRGGGWRAVTHREGAMLKTKDGKSVSLADISGFATSGSLGVIITSVDGHPARRARVQIKEVDTTLWAVSLLEGHGEVWWKKESFTERDDSSKDVLTTEEVLKRPVFSYALTSSLQGLVSAHGIYRTTDGKKWTRLEQFGSQDLPVALASSGAWFVGSSKSVDHGVTFEPFIRWEGLTNKIERELRRAPHYVRLQKVEPTASGVNLTVDTGIRRLSLKFDGAETLHRSF